MTFGSGGCDREAAVLKADNETFPIEIFGVFNKATIRKIFEHSLLNLYSFYESMPPPKTSSTKPKIRIPDALQYLIKTFTTFVNTNGAEARPKAKTVKPNTWLHPQSPMQMPDTSDEHAKCLCDGNQI